MPAAVQVARMELERGVSLVTTYSPEARVRRPHLSSWLVGLAGLAAIVVAAIVGYAVAGGFTTESPRGQDVADSVMQAWATGDSASIAAVYDPAVKVVLIYDNTEHVIASSAKELIGVIKGAIGLGNTYRQIGPVASYEAKDSDLYVTSMVEVKGLGHPNGDPLVGFYRVRNGKVTKHIFMDAEHY
jgi:hypothetical protein